MSDAVLDSLWLTYSTLENQSADLCSRPVLTGERPSPAKLNTAAEIADIDFTSTFSAQMNGGKLRGGDSPCTQLRVPNVVGKTRGPAGIDLTRRCSSLRVFDSVNRGVCCPIWYLSFEYYSRRNISKGSSRPSTFSTSLYPRSVALILPPIFKPLARAWRYSQGDLPCPAWITTNMPN